MSEAQIPGPPIAHVLLLRHAETAVPGRFHGAESDVDLSERGLDQARQAAIELAGRHPAAVYCSTMLRARRTATEIAEACGLGVQRVEGLHERRMGPLSGLSHAEGLPHYEADRTRWMAGDLDATFPGAESFAQVRDRAVPVLRRLVAAHPGETIVVVVHGVVIRVLLTSLVEGLSPADFDRVPIEFVGVHEVVVEGERWRLVEA